MRNAKGLSTVTQGGEERANKIAAKQKQKTKTKKPTKQNIVKTWEKL